MNIGPSSLPDIRRVRSRLANVQELLFRMRDTFLRFAKTSTFSILLYAVLASSILTAVVLNVKVVQVVEGSGTRTIYTFRSNPEAILQQGGIHLSKDDRYAFTGIQNRSGRIHVFTAFPVQITADGKTQKVMAATGTVGDVLKKAGVQLGADDTINVKPEQAVAHGMSIQIARVRYETSTVQNPIPYQTQVTQDATLPQGTRNVLASGQNGVETITFRQKYVDGNMEEQVEAGRSDVPPVNEQVVVGTAAPVQASSTSVSTQTAKSTTANRAADGVPGSYTKVYSGVGTAYTAKAGALTASGRTVAKGIVAVDPTKIPYGTKLYIATPDGSFVYGTAVAADTGGFVHNGSGVLIDLFFPTEAECETFGKQSVNVYVLE